MEVILREDIDKIGARGALVKVADGFARNYLLPRKLAVAATASNKKIVEQEREAYVRREAKAEAESQDLAKLLTNVTLTFRSASISNGARFS
jgi:large subunit ribosomal protein L9